MLEFGSADVWGSGPKVERTEVWEETERRKAGVWKKLELERPGVWKTWSLAELEVRGTEEKES